LAIFPINGSLGTGATFEVDLNLVVQVVMGVALVAGALLAKRKRYVAHGICQTTVLLLNPGMIALVMSPSLQHQVRPALPGSLHKWFYAMATIHSLVGGAAEFLGLYIVIVAGTRILPQSLRFKDWKRWMRAGLTLWSIVVLTGVGTYCA
jgi:uncharacterized membrane protein YozB (DUF420 family)